MDQDEVRDGGTGPSACIPLRVQARMHYCLVDQGISLARMARTPPFHVVPLRTLENWSAADGWPELRRQAQEDWAARVRERIGDELIQKRIDQLRSLENLEAQVKDLLDSGVLQFRSLEGAIHALVRLAQVTDDLREKVLADLPGARSREPRPSLVPRLTHDEARSVAAHILALRRGRDMGQKGEMACPQVTKK